MCSARAGSRWGWAAGENLNEHVIGEGWPPVNTRHRMLREAVQIIKELFSGEYVTYQGEFFDVDSAKLYDLPERRIPIGVAASGGQSADLAAEFGDLLIVNEPMPEVVDQFNSLGGSGKPVYGQLAIAYDTDAEAAKERAHGCGAGRRPGGRSWPSCRGRSTSRAYADYVRPEDVAEQRAVRQQRGRGGRGGQASTPTPGSRTSRSYRSATTSSSPSSAGPRRSCCPRCAASETAPALRRC